MAKLKTTKANADWDPIPESEVVEALLSAVEEYNYEWKGDTVYGLNWEFVVSEEPWKGRKVRGRTTLNFVPHPNCKAYVWAKALTGVSYEEGDELDTDDLTGLKGRIIIGHRVDKKDSSRIWEQVREVLPMRAARAVSPMDDDDLKPF